MDESDASAASAALREAWEELGIPAESVEILGLLPEFHTVSNYVVTPVVGLLEWPIPLTLAPDEVARAFTIPLAWLMDPANRRVEKRQWSDGHSLSVIFFKEYDGETLWGASARFTTSLVEALAEG
jgi:8-oxo-dGTP pyrophosphatase MutT (NUDIX family)